MMHMQFTINNQIKFKTIMLKSSLCDYSDAYVFVKGTVTVVGQWTSNI